MLKGDPVSFLQIAKELENELHEVNKEKKHKVNPSNQELTSCYSDVFRKDIQMIRGIMKTTPGLSLDMLETEGNKRNMKYHYRDNTFSILPYLDYRYSAKDYKGLERALDLLRGSLPEQVFELVEFSLKSHVEYDFGEAEKNIDYGENLCLKGRERLPFIYKVLNKKVLKVCYQPFGKEPIEFVFHPYLLKQYNNRWFLFGRHDEKDLDYWNVPVDRIFNIQELSNVDFKNRPKEYLNHFHDFIGVHDGRFDGDESGAQNDKKIEDLGSPNKQHEKEIIKMKIKTKGLWGRMKTKPLHESQSVYKDFDDDLNYGLLTIEVIPNVEFYNQLVSLGENAVVEEPQNVKDLVVQRLKNTLKNYEH